MLGVEIPVTDLLALFLLPLPPPLRTAITAQYVALVQEELSWEAQFSEAHGYEEEPPNTEEQTLLLARALQKTGGD